MPLQRFEVRNEYGLGDPELYRGAVKREDPKAVLDGVAVAGLVGILRQLGDLAEFAADIFHDLHEQVTTTTSRGRKVMTRVRNIEAALPSLEKAIRAQTSHIHLAYIRGCEWHARVQTEKSHILSSDLPRFMMDSYEECRDPPRLYLLDKFDNGGPGVCLKRYSDPTFFEKAWDMLSKVKNAENAHKEKKHHKVKRKGSRSRNGEQLHNAPSRSRLRNGALPDMLIASQHDSQRFTSPSSDTHSLSENRSIPGVGSNPDLISRSTSLGSKSRFSLVEQITDPDPVSGPSALPDETVYPSSSSLKHEEKDGDYYANGVPISAPISPPRSITWDEKAPIIATASTVFSDDVIMDQVHVGPMSGNQDISPEGRKLPSSPTLVTTNHEEVVSETENYVDALNTLESETETETEVEFHSKWEMNQLHDLGSKSDVKPINECSDALQVDPSDDLLASQRSEAGNEDVFRQHESPQHSGFASTEVCEANAVSPNDGWSENENASMREPQSQEVSDIAPVISSLVPNESSLMNAEATKFQTSDYSQDKFQGYSEIAPTGFPEHTVPPEADLLDPTEEPYNIENSPRVKIKPRNASRRYEFLEYSEIPPLAVLPSHPLPDQVVQSNFENAIIDHPHRSEEEPGVSSTITAESVENEMQTTVSDVQTIHANGMHDAIRDETTNLEEAPFNVSSAKLWTNAGLFGLEPSKPPVFASANNRIKDVPHSGANGSVPNSSLSEVDKHLPDNSSINLSHENRGNDTANLSSSFSSLAQRFLTNTLQKRISSSPSPSPLSYPEPATHASSIDSDARRSVQGSPSHHSTGQSSPPLEFMKISFYPTNGNMCSNIDEGMNYDARFPDFQILPGPAHQPGDSGSDSDEDTFGRSYAYSSEDLSPRLFSNSDVWDPDEIPNYSEHPSASGASASNYMGFEQADLHGIETVSNLNRNLNSNYVLENENQMPPPPPLPPVQWRLIKPPGSSMGDTSTNLGPQWQNHVSLPPAPAVPAVSFPPKLNRNEEKPEVNGNANHTLIKEMKLEGEIIHWNRKKLDNQKPNGNEKPKRDVPDTKDLDEREELLYQIRNKSFNLRPTAKSKPDADSSEVPTNSSVSAIIEKANAIRQAFVGSDDGGDDDRWSDM